MKLKKGDKIKMIRGKDNGKTGVIARIFPKKETILVDGLNTYKKNKKPKKEGEKGQVVVLSRPFAPSKAMLVCPKCGKATRVGYVIETNKDGKKVKTRICKKCNAKI